MEAGPFDLLKATAYDYLAHTCDSGKEIKEFGFLNDQTQWSSIEGKQPGFFYGYTIILVSFLIFMVSWGSQYSFGVFFKPVLNEFGWTRAATSGAYSLNMVLMGGFGLLAGRLCDKFGPCLVMTACGLLLGLGYLLMSRVTDIWQIYVFYGVLVGIGMSGSFVPLLSTVARWFVRRRALASGIVVSGVGVGMLIMPLLANLLISNYSWQTSYFIFGLIIIVLIGVTAQFLRRPPGQGPLPAGKVQAAPASSSNLQVQGLSLREAIHTRQLWTICVMYFFFVFGQQIILVHIVAHATDIGVTAATAATLLSVIGVVSIGGKLLMGSLGDRIGNKRIMTFAYLMIALSFVWLRLAGEMWMLYLFAVIFGLSYAGFAAVQSPLAADFFGLRSHGVIFGLVSAITSAGGALGSFVAGRIFDISGSYYWAFILGAILSVVSLILSILLKPARRKIEALQKA
jgi:MFS family permease